MNRVIISFDLATKEIRIFEDCTLQQLIDICKEHETDLSKVIIKTQLFPEPIYTTSYIQVEN